MERDDTEKLRRENGREAAALVLAMGQGGFRRTLLLLLLFPLLFFTGAGALGTYVLSRVDTGFYASAQEARAVVTAKAPDEGGILSLAFTDAKGRAVHAKTADGGYGLRIRDTAAIYYDPENPEHVRLAMSDPRMPLCRLSRIFLYAFLGLCAFAWFVAGPARGERR